MSEYTVSVAKIASTLRIGVRLAKAIARENFALLPDGTVDASKLFEQLAIPSESLAELSANLPVLLTVREVAMRSGVSMRTVHSYLANHERPFQFPRQIVLSPHHRHFVASEIAAYEFGVSERMASEVVLENAGGTVSDTGICSTTKAGSGNPLEFLEAIMPPAPRQKQVRKK